MYNFYSKIENEDKFEPWGRYVTDDSGEVIKPRSMYKMKDFGCRPIVALLCNGEYVVQNHLTYGSELEDNGTYIFLHKVHDISTTLESAFSASSSSSASKIEKQPPKKKSQPELRTGETNLGKTEQNRKISGEMPPLVKTKYKKKMDCNHDPTHYPKRDDCQTCLENVRRTRATRVPEGQQTREIEFGMRLHTDLIGPCKREQNSADNCYILVIQDDASGYLHAETIDSKSDALCAIQLLLLRWKIQPGAVLQSDNGGEFGGSELVENSKFKEMLNEFDVFHEHSVPLRPQSNSRAERAVQTVLYLTR